MQLRDKIFTVNSGAAFEEAAVGVFRFQAERCGPYREYLRLIGTNPKEITELGKIPFLPIELFKTHEIYSAAAPPEKVFTSSATTGMVPSRHPVADLSLYEESFTRGFELFYGDPGNLAIFALLPNYLERSGSSLVYMADRLIKDSAGGGFYLYDLEKLVSDLQKCNKPQIVLGVSYALWNMAEKYPHQMKNTIIMETGGMKGQRAELPKPEFHALLCDVFGVESIHSEYGMAELLSQAYSAGQGIFRCPPWMKVTARDINDPFTALPADATGGINIIDLANLYSCSFIQTQDMGKVHEDGSFEILGRITGSEIRGCNLLVQ